MAVRFDLAEVPEQGRAAAGVRGMSLDAQDKVIDALYLPGAGKGSIAVFTETGKAKRTPLEAYPVQGRGGKGTQSIKRLIRASHRLIGGAIVALESEPWWFSTSAGRIVYRIPTDIGMAARDGNPTRLIDLEPGETLVHQAVHLQRLAELLAGPKTEAPELLMSQAATTAAPRSHAGKNGAASTKGQHGLDWGDTSH
jgi:DNA gyrase/topoisomerase IV subunit A